MALQAQVGNTTVVSGNSNTTVNTNFAASLILLLGNRQLTTGYTADASITLGFGDTHTIVGTHSAQEVDNQTTDCNSLMAGWGNGGNLHCYEPVKTGNSTFEQFSTMPINPTNFVMTVGSPTPPNAHLLNFLALGGSDITNFNSNSFNNNTTLGNRQSITSVGFQPDLVLFSWASWLNTNSGQGANTAMSFGYGAAIGSGTGNQWACGTAGQGPTNSTHKTIQRTDRCIIVGNLTTLDTDANFVSMDANGFTIAIQTGGGRAVCIGWIAIKGPKVKVGSFNKSTQVAPVTDSINLGFLPKACFVVSHGTVSSTAIQNDSTVSIGFTDGVKQANVWVGMKHAAATAGAHSRHLTNNTITIASGTAAGVTPTTIAEANITFANTGFNVNWTTNDATPDEVLYWVVGNAVGPAQPITAQQAVKRVKFW